MAARKKRTADAEGVGYTNVLLEEIRAKQDAMYEAMVAMGEGLRGEFRSEIAKVTQRLDVLESVVRQNSEDIKVLRAEVAELRAEVAELRTEVRQLRRDFDNREERTKIAALEARVTELERLVKAG